MRLFYLIKTLYPVIGEPLSLGAIQSITTFKPSTFVVGAEGWSGFFAARIDTSFEYPTLKSKAFLDFTLNV
jgi:hypothetical protein